MKFYDKTPIIQDVDVIGRVQIDYTDGITGKVKERITDHNHVFLDAFNTSGWRDVLNTTATDNFFITDNNTPPNDDFQYLRGNVIGWGRVSNEGSGAYRGKFLANESILEGDIGNGVGRRWKYVYTFTGDQIALPIGSIGISHQYNNLRDCQIYQYPNKWRKYANENNSYVTRGGKCYSITDGGTVTVYSPFSGEKTVIDVSNIVGSSGRNLSIGMADDSLKTYIMAYSATAAQRQMYEFLDETFAVLINTYNWSNLTNIPARRVFVVYGDEAWWYHGGGRHGSFKENVNPVTVVAATTDAYNTTVGTDNHGSVISFDGKLFNTYDYSGTGNKMSDPVWDMATDRQIAHINLTRRNGTTDYQGQAVLDPSAPNGHNVVLFSQTAGGWWVLKQAMTCYALPDGAPERPDGAGVKITYTIDVNY